MPEKPPGELMRDHDELADMENQYRRRKVDKLNQIQEALEAAVTSAVADAPPEAEVYKVNDTGERHSLRLRFDRPELIKQLTETLPDEFTVNGINDDGTIDVAWIESATNEDHHLTTTLRGIIASETPNDEYAEITLQWEDIVDKAVSLGFEQETVERRLHKLDEYDVIEVHDQNGEPLVSPGSAFNS